MTERPPLAAPFLGVRFADVEVLSRVLAPPYDVISPAERVRLTDRDPHNVVRYILPDGDDGRYEAADALLRQWLQDGVVIADDEPTVTVVLQTFRTADGSEYRRTGVIVGVSAEPFGDGRVRPHERTHKGPKEDRLSLLRASAFIFESLLMFAPDRDQALYRRVREVQEAPPLAEGELDDVRVAVWRIGGDAGREIADLAGRSDLYIADGHHRYETAVAYAAETPGADRIPALVMSLADPGVVVEATHRIVVGEAVNAAVLETQFRERFQIKELAGGDDPREELRSLSDRGTGCVVALPSGQTFALLLKGGDTLEGFATGLNQAVASLDVLRVDELVVKPLLAAAGGEARLEYEADAREALHVVRAGAAGAAVLLNPTPVERVIAVADAGEVMPPKSTYFYPKVPSGLVGMQYPRVDRPHER
jgi:uncharacterized protein (DUF1015 family)